MKKRLVIGFVVVGLGVLAVVWFARRPRERPVYQGKSVREWALELYAPEAARREAATGAFETLGSNAVPGLVGLLRVRDSFFRKKAWALAPRLPFVVQRVVLKRLHPPDAVRIRSGAARSLAIIGPEARASVPLLAKALRTDEPQVRFDAAIALGRIGGSGIGVLTEVLTNQDPNVRHAAASGLGEASREAEAAAPGLLKALEDPSAGVGLSAASSLSKLGTNVLPILTNTIVNGDALARQRAARALTVLRLSRAEVVPPLLTMLRDKDPDCRAQAARSLGTFQLPNRAMVESLVAVLQDPVIEVRLAAIRGLTQARRRAADAVPGLIVCLSDVSPQIREETARALGLLGPSAISAVPELGRMIGDKEETVRLAAKEAVGKIEVAGEGTGTNIKPPNLIFEP